ncbi:MAG TPA: extracellular solute-binding protein [Candidatus Binatia bacterium]|nr:extracellular solute-binding protein [Candidatus Binatia bacterium]
MTSRNMKNPGSLFTTSLVFGFLALSGLLQYSMACAATGNPSQEEWDKTIKAAEKEGQLTLYANEGLEGSINDFQKRFPRVKVVLVSGRSGQLVTRLMAERRAGKYLADVAKLGTGSASALYRARPFPLQPVDGNLFLSEVTDKSKWWQGKHQYADPEGKFILSPCVSVHIDMLSYNTEVVKPSELTSYGDILNPKWKGKIGSMDPRAAGGREGGRLIYFHPELGPDFFRRLLTEMDLVLSQEPRQAVDWLAQGKLAFLLFTSPREVLRAKDQKLPVDILDPRRMKEAPVVETAASSFLLMDKPANPHAAKLFLNWLLSREGQISFQKSQGSCDSARLDIPKDDVPPISRRKDGVQYFKLWDTEWMDVDEVQKFIDGSLKGVKVH